MTWNQNFHAMCDTSFFGATRRLFRNPWKTMGADSHHSLRGLTHIFTWNVCILVQYKRFSLEIEYVAINFALFNLR